MIISVGIRIVIDIMRVVCLIDCVGGKIELQKLIHLDTDSKGCNLTSTSRESQGKLTVLNGSLDLYEYGVKEIVRFSND